MSSSTAYPPDRPAARDMERDGSPLRGPARRSRTTRVFLTSPRPSRRLGTDNRLDGTRPRRGGPGGDLSRSPRRSSLLGFRRVGPILSPPSPESTSARLL